MHYVYVLKSRKDDKFYVGYTEDLIRRFKEHQEGKSISTKNRRPLQLVYYEACTSKRDALIRERYLKSAWGKRYIKNRVKNSA
ncbi:MAG: putative endonuclease [Parcubacteria group bacterium Gr01-1014_2]|nr:MAG: putative endonuclease [Parcubacteria group bacterium Gr01-1014_2]